MMRMRIGLLRFVRDLSDDRSERRRLGAAVVVLLRQRRRSLIALGPVLRVVPTGGKAKLRLWQSLARSFLSNTFVGCKEPNALAEAIRSTQAYANAAVALSHDRNGFLQRGTDYDHLRRLWSTCSPERLLVFHHYDRRGLMPNSWCEALTVLQAAGPADCCRCRTPRLSTAGAQRG